MKKLLKPFFAVSNWLVRHVLRSRFHWLLSWHALLLQVTGRKSGRVYLVPVSYTSTEDGVAVMTYRRRMWWRNIASGSEFPVYFRGKLVTVVPEVITDDVDAIGRSLRNRWWGLKSTIRAKAKDSVLIKLRFDGRE